MHQRRHWLLRVASINKPLTTIDVACCSVCDSIGAVWQLVVDLCPHSYHPPPPHSSPLLLSLSPA